MFFEVARDAEGVEDAICEGFCDTHSQNHQQSPTTVTPLPSDLASDFAAGAFSRQRQRLAAFAPQPLPPDHMQVVAHHRVVLD